ncbi:MAG: cysteine desulfurase [Parachlamydiaceae bacterium]|nr:cysteine desulfurase [Parachlamydiaceae bacterium]
MNESKDGKTLKHPFEEHRKDFPMLKKMMHGHPLIYFDSAATAQKPQVVIDAITDFYTNNYGTVHRAIYELAVHATTEYQATRSKVQAFLNASEPGEIVFTRGTTEAINLVAHSFRRAFLKPGDEIIISTMEHHSNIVPWQLACEESGAILKIALINDKGELILDSFKELLSDKTKLVAITHMSNALGTINPIKELAKLVHESGAKIFVDGAQGAPHMPIDVQDLDVDFYAFSGHKAYGPTGIGVLYGKKELLELMPPYQGGGDMIKIVTFEKTTYNDLPLKFEAGTPMIAEVIGLGAAIDYLNTIGMGTIRTYEHELLLYATETLKSVPGVTIIGNAENKGAIISFNVEGIHPLDIGTLLDLRGIAVRTGHHCAQPVTYRYNISSTIRVSFAFYNTRAEIDHFIVMLNEVIALLR